jgi:hypothetical protein
VKNKEVSEDFQNLPESCFLNQERALVKLFRAGVPGTPFKKTVSQVDFL